MIESLRDLLGRALARAGLEATSDAFRVAEAWEEAVGPTVAARARPAGFERGELLIAAPDAVWRQELVLLAPDIKQKINRALGSDVVQRVRIVGGPVPAGPVPRGSRQAPPRMIHRASRGPRPAPRRRAPAGGRGGEMDVRERSGGRP